MKNVVILVLLLFLMVGCSFSPSPSADYMILEDVQYVKDFPHTYSLTGKEPVDLDVIGMQSFRIFDSLLVISTSDKDGLWSFFSLEDNRYLGKLIRKGNGPNEFVQSPFVSNAFFWKKDSLLFADIYDFQKGAMYKLNVGESLRKGNACLSEYSVSLPPFLFNYAMLDSVSYFIREIDNGETQQTRSLFINGAKEVPHNAALLNRSMIQRGEDFNILSVLMKCNREKRLIVEAPITLNYLNLYSADGDWGKTICVDDKVDNITRIQERSKADRLYTYGDLCVYPDFWAALYINEDNLTYQMGRKKLPVIQVFDWEGNPIAELKLPAFATSFDIDLQHGYLYTLDLKTDEFCRYDVRNILQDMKGDL